MPTTDLPQKTKNKLLFTQPIGARRAGSEPSLIHPYNFKKVLADVVAVTLLVLTVAALLALTIALAAKAL